MLLQSQHAVQLFRRARDFLVRSQPIVAYGAIKVHVDTLGQVAERLAAFAIEQDTMFRSGRGGTITLRRLLRVLKLEYMRPIVRIARSAVPEDPTVAATMRVPARLRRPEELIAAAQAMANSALPHKERFIAAGFPTDFIERLRAAALIVHQAVDARAKDLGRRAASSAGVRTEVQRGRAVLSLLNSMVAPRLETNPELAAEWRSMMRQGRFRRSEEPVIGPALAPSGATGSGGVPPTVIPATLGTGEVNRPE